MVSPSAALAAIGFAKAKRRRQIMVATSSIGPGALNMVTAAGTAHANRLQEVVHLDACGKRGELLYCAGHEVRSLPGTDWAWRL